MGKLLKGRCVFVLKDRCSGPKERKVVPGILGMNVIGEHKGFLTDFKGIKKLDRGTPQPGQASLHVCWPPLKKRNGVWAQMDG